MQDLAIPNLSARQRRRFYQPVLILGLPRGGSSLTAGALKECGLWLGTTVAAGPQNPKGFFEHVRLRDKVNKTILRALGTDELGIASQPELDKVRETEVAGFDKLVASIIAKDGYDFNRLWGFKDTKITLLWPLWARFFPKAKWIVVDRPMEEFIASCQRTNFMSQHSMDPDYWKAVYHKFQERVEALKTEHQVMTISTPDLIAGKTDGLKEAVGWAGLNWNEVGVASFIDRDLWNRPTYDK